MRKAESRKRISTRRLVDLQQSYTPEGGFGAGEEISVTELTIKYAADVVGDVFSLMWHMMFGMPAVYEPLSDCELFTKC